MSTTRPPPGIILESSDYLDARIHDKQEQILITKQRLLKQEVDLAHLKQQKASTKRTGSIREQLRAVLRRG